MIDRKEFLKKSCNACLLGAAALLLPNLTGCGSANAVFKTEAIDDKITIPLELFAKGNLQMVRPKGWNYEIAVNKNNDGTYTALLLQCTHMENQLVPLQNGYVCSLHGSRFDGNGGVIKGPAEMALKKYKSTVNNSNLILLLS